MPSCLSRSSEALRVPSGRLLQSRRGGRVYRATVVARGGQCRVWLLKDSRRYVAPSSAGVGERPCLLTRSTTGACKPSSAGGSGDVRHHRKGSCGLAPRQQRSWPFPQQTEPLADWIVLTRLGPQEKDRQKHFINLIPSENFTSQAVLDALGSPMQSTSAGVEDGATGEVNGRN